MSELTTPAATARPAWFGYVVVIAAVVIVLLLGYVVHTYQQATVGPTTQQARCAKFDAVSTAITKVDASDNAAFTAVGQLGEAAARYDDASVKQEAGPLHKLAHASSTNGLQIMNATTAIANVCGHPLGLGMGGLG